MSIYENTPAYCERAAHIAEKAMPICKGMAKLYLMLYEKTTTIFERRKQMKKMLSLILVIVMVFAISSSAFALSLTANSTISGPILYYQKAGSGFSLSATGSSISTVDSATALTIRAYNAGTSTRCSNAKTYRAGSLSGGQHYWENATPYVDIWGSIDASGSVTVSGTWTF